MVKNHRYIEGMTKMSLKIGVIKGDGIGPEICNGSDEVLDKAGEVYGFDCSYEQLLLGGASD